MTNDSPPRSLKSCGLLILVGLFCAVCAGIPSFFVGQFSGYLLNDIERGDRDVARVERILEAHPRQFGSLTFNRGPGDRFHLEGAVSTQDALDLLRDEMVRAFGEEKADYILEVTVASTADSRSD